MNTYFSPSRKGLFNVAVGDDSVLLTPEVAQALLEAMGNGELLDADAEGNPITVPAPAPEVFDPEADYLAKPIGERLLIQLGRLNADYDQAVTVLSSDYPKMEIQTWTIQATEAREYQAWIDGGRVGDAPATPFLAPLNTGRTAEGVGEGMEDLVKRVLINDSMFSPVLAQFTAQRHGAEKRLIDAAKAGDDAVFNAITWSFEMPSAPVAE